VASNIRQRNGHRRRQVRARVLAEEDTCGICHQWVDVTLPAGLPESPEVDEIQPVSRGGNPLDRDNCRLAHRLCNQRRGNGRRDRKAVQPYRTTRTW
jgi:5-methylcytosine-specific restriction endonuclease McrA